MMAGIRDLTLPYWRGTYGRVILHPLWAIAHSTEDLWLNLLKVVARREPATFYRRIEVKLA